MVSQSGEMCTFRVQCRGAKRVFLAGNFEDGRTKVVPMHEGRDEFWVAQLRLAPGNYKFRYYIDNGRAIICHPPDDVRPWDSGEWDAHLEVGQPALLSEDLRATPTKRCQVPPRPQASSAHARPTAPRPPAPRLS